MVVVGYYSQLLGRNVLDELDKGHLAFYDVIYKEYSRMNPVPIFFLKFFNRFC